MSEEQRRTDLARYALMTQGYGGSVLGKLNESELEVLANLVEDAGISEEASTVVLRTVQEALCRHREETRNQE